MNRWLITTVVSLLILTPLIGLSNPPSPSFNYFTQRSFNTSLHLPTQPTTVTVYHYSPGWWWPYMYWWNEETSQWEGVSMSSDGSYHYATVTFPKLPVRVYFAGLFTRDDNDGDYYWISDIDLNEQNKTWVKNGFIHSTYPEGRPSQWFSKTFYWHAYEIWADTIEDLGSNRYLFQGNIIILQTNGFSWSPVLRYKLDKAMVAWRPETARLTIIDGKFRIPSGYGLPYYIQEGRIRGLHFDVDANRILTGDHAITLTSFVPGNPQTTPEIYGIRASSPDAERNVFVLNGVSNGTVRNIKLSYQGDILFNQPIPAGNRSCITLGQVTFCADFIQVDACGYYHLSGSITTSAGSFIFNDLEIIYNEQTQKITLRSGTFNVGVAELTLRDILIDAQTGQVLIGGGTLRIPELILPEGRIIRIVADFDWAGIEARGRLETPTYMVYVQFHLAPDGTISNIVTAGATTLTFGNTTITAQWIADLGNNSYSFAGNVQIEGFLFAFDDLDITYNDVEHTITLRRGQIVFPNTFFVTVQDVVFDVDTHEILVGQLTVGMEEIPLGNGRAAGLRGDFFTDHLHFYGRYDEGSTAAFQVEFDLTYNGTLSNIAFGMQLNNLQFGSVVISAEAWWRSPSTGEYIFTGNVKINTLAFTFEEVRILWNENEQRITVTYAQLDVPGFSGNVSGLEIDAITGNITVSSVSVNFSNIRIGNYEIQVFSATFTQEYIEADGSFGIPGLINTINGIRVHFRIDWKGNIYSIGGGVIGEIPLLDTGISIYNPYIQIDNENGFIEEGGLNRTGWVFLISGTLAPSTVGTGVVAEDVLFIIEPHMSKVTANGILKVGGGPVADTTVIIEPGHVYANANATVRLFDDGSFEIHSDAWVDFSFDSNLNIVKRSGAGRGYISYMSHRIVDSDFALDDEKAYGQAQVTILQDWLDFCLTWELWNDGTFNVTWGCDTPPPPPSPCSQPDALPTCPSNLLAHLETPGIRLTWDAASDDHGVVAYKIYRDGTQMAQVSAPQQEYMDTTVMNDYQYSYNVFSVDTAGQIQMACKNIVAIAGGSGFFLMVTKDSSGQPVLQWMNGPNLPEYILYRGTEPNHYVEWVRVPSRTFVDSDPSTNPVFYIVQQHE